MSAWLVAAAAGIAAAALSYLGRAGGATRAAPALALLRALAVTALAALALDAPAGRTRAVPPLVALDASASWGRGGDRGAFSRALDTARAAARAAGADTVWLVGDSLRPAGSEPTADDVATRLGALRERAAGAGRPFLLVSDGESDERDALRDAPRGSRVVVVAPSRGADAALVALEAPRVAAATDTADVRVAVGADAGGARAGTLTLALGGRAVATAPLAPLPPFGERTVVLRAPLAGGAGGVLLQASLASGDDRDARNDTLAVAIEVSGTAAAVFVTTAPDYDARATLGVMRGALALPARAYVRVAPNAWRVEGTLAPVAEAEVARAARAASLLVLHGDTTMLGAPRAATRAALALFPTSGGARSDDEWYATGAPPSPIAAALSGAAWDSLPPVDVPALAPAGEWVGLEARRARRGDARAVVAGTEGGRRVVVVGATGFWRWQFRGGVAADAFTGLWGAILDWLAAGRGDERAAVPAEGTLRAGEPVRWTRGGLDSSVTVVLQRRGAQSNDAPRVDSVRVRFAPGATFTQTAALTPGVYDVRAPGGTAVIAVNPSRELLPRRATLQSGPVGTGPVADRSPRLRDVGWMYALVLALLCAEWLLRRRAGLR